MNREYSAVNDDNYEWASVALTSQQGLAMICILNRQILARPIGLWSISWYQVFKNTGRGVGLFAQINFNCEQWLLWF